jgi:hypothetical protein
MAIHVHDPSFDRNYRRTRFSIAHELVHALIIRVLDNPSLVASLDATPEGLAELESVCDIGASHLLMPPRLIRDRLRVHGLTPPGLLNLYDEFLVSRDALLYGIASVLPRGSAMRWRHIARTPQEPVAWRIVGSYPRYGSDPQRPWLPRGATAKHLSQNLPDVVARTGAVLSCDSLTVTLGKRDWRRAAYGTFLGSRPRGASRPLFSGLVVSDEAAPIEVFVFLAERASSAPWSAHTSQREENRSDA